VVRFTEDGTAGERGLVTAGLEPWLAGAQRVYACGSNLMLAATFRRLGELALRSGGAPPLEVSIEAPMGCGFGICLGCVIPLRHESGAAVSEFGLCCRQGPVLRGELLDWERLLQQPAHLE
jgi:dihydroorotate dehydrogenase electron transfer subunit